MQQSQPRLFSAHCYAETLVTGRMGRAGTWGEDGVRQRTAPGNWRKPILWNENALKGLLPDGSENPDGHRPRVFCASLADVFEPRLELHPWRRDLFALIEATPELDWLLLTKRPDVAGDWLHSYYSDLACPGDYQLPWEPFENVWLGTSIENSRFTWRADALREAPAAVRFISAEPLLGSLFQEAPTTGTPDGVSALSSAPEGGAGAKSELDGAARRRAPLDLTGIDWVIVGGESGGRNARPMHPRWVSEIREAVLDRGRRGYGDTSDRSKTPALHFKQWGSWAPAASQADGVWVSPDGRTRSSLAADAYGDLPDGSMRMRYVGASPKSGGKLIDGVEYCEFPQYDPVPA